MSYDDIDKELGPLIDKFQHTVKEQAKEAEKKNQEDEKTKNQFKQLAKDVIIPEMRKIIEYLKEKGEMGCWSGMK